MIQYDNLEQRIAAFYINLLAPFVPAKEIDLESQEAFYAFVSDFLHRIYDCPETFFSKLHEDDAHPNRFNNASYGKPQLKRDMKANFEKIKGLFLLLAKFGQEGEVREGGIAIPFRPGRKEQKQMAFLGLQMEGDLVYHPGYPRMAAAWKWLAGKPDAISLERCWFADDYPYLEKTFARFYDPEAYGALVTWLKADGYKMYVSGKDYASVGSSTILDFAKCTAKDDTPIGYAIHGDKFHYGFTFEYRYEPRVAQHCELRILRFKEMLQRFDEHPESVRALIVEKTKRCDDCGYCTQTDKTGKRPRADISLRDGTSLCPYYPGFNFVFETLDMQRVEEIKAFIGSMERVIAGK